MSAATGGVERLEFRADGPLPTGFIALEASAGTGKTYALTALAIRFIAEEQLTASQLCIVTFTEAATAELRGRVRERIAETARHVGAVLAGTAVDSDDPVLAAVAHDGADAETLARRGAALQRALAEFDTATIATIHGFCSRVLAGRDHRGALTNGDASLLHEVATDMLLAAIDADPGFECRPDRLIIAAEQQLRMPDAQLLDAYAHHEKALSARHEAERLHTVRLRELVTEIVAEVRARREQRAERTFDSLITDTRDLLAGPEAATVVRQLRERYGVVLIDEFQDTDQVQWDIFRRAFVDPVAGADGTEPARPAMVIVGDPKQSIYRFRSADISAYLDAVSRADEVRTLGTNWRSDEPLLTGLEHLMTGFEFGSAAVTFQPVGAAPDRGESRLIGDVSAPLAFRYVDSGGADLGSDKLRSAVRRDLVGVVQQLLGGSVQILPDRRPVQAGDVAVLTRSNAEASLVAEMLATAGIPASQMSRQSVLGSLAARQWQVLLQALERPTSAGAARAAALGWFLPTTADQLDRFDEEQSVELHDLLRGWSSVLRRGGLPALLGVARAEGLHERILARPGGQRDLTDLDHVAEVLQTLCPSTAPGALLAALRHADDDADEDTARDVLARRIDRDDDAVQIVTIHSSKGLEFPVVLVPFMWTSRVGRHGLPHAAIDGQRYLDSSWIPDLPRTNGRNGRIRDTAKLEERSESRRLLYVALTRARHRCVVWWANLSDNRGSSILGDLLETQLGAVPRTPAAFEPLVARSQGTISVHPVPADIGAPMRIELGEPADDVGELGVAMASRTGFDPAWRIWSFTAIADAARTASAASGSIHDHAPESLPVTGGLDEATGEAPIPREPIGTPLAEAPAGAAFGTLVHRILERADFTADPLVPHLDELCTNELARRPLRTSSAELATGLAHALHTPLCGPLESFRLTELSRADRLDELEFHLPLGSLRASDIAAVLARTLDADDPVRPWAIAVAGADGAGSAGAAAASGFGLDLAGRLTGSIDLTFRHVIDHTPTYFVADYKTNRLAGRAEYAPDALAAAMAHHHYPLQAVLYLVALHRYLRWRLADYHPDRHLGGAAYLFVRGMDAAAGPGHGVFWWHPPSEAVLAVDRLLAEHGAVASIVAGASGLPSAVEPGR